MYVCMYVRMHVCMYVCLYVCRCARVDLRTHRSLPEVAAITKEDNEYTYVSKREARGRAVKEEKEKEKKEEEREKKEVKRQKIPFPNPCMN